MAGYCNIGIIFYIIFSLYGIRVGSQNTTETQNRSSTSALAKTTSATDLQDNMNTNVTTDMTSTPNTETTTANNTNPTPEDPDYTLVYIVITAVLLALAELILLIVLITRCLRTFRKMGENGRPDEENNENGQESSILSFVNKTYGFFHRKASVDNRQESTSETKNSSETAMSDNHRIHHQDPGYMDVDMNVDILTDRKDDFQQTSKSTVMKNTKKLKCHDPGYIDIDKPTDLEGDHRRTKETDTKKTDIKRTNRRHDPGYMDIDVNIGKPTDQQEDFQRRKKNEAEFINKSYSHIEVNREFTPSTDRSTYSHVKRSEDEGSCIREKTNNNSQHNKYNMENDNDTEYDHAVYRRSYETFGDTKTYSRLSSVMPRKNPFLRLVEEETEISVEGNEIKKTQTANTTNLKESCKTDIAMKDLKMTEKSSCTSELKGSRQYRYSKVNKTRKNERMQQESGNEHHDKSKEEKDMKSPDTVSGERCEVETNGINGAFEVLEKCTSDVKPKMHDAYSEVKERSQEFSDKPKSERENMAKIDQNDRKNMPNKMKPDIKYEYSKVIKKTTNKKEFSKVEGHGNTPDSDKRSFIISEVQEHDNLNKRHEYVNIKKQTTG